MVVWFSYLAGMIVFGAVLLLFGRLIGRFYLVLIGAGIGLAIAGPIAQRTWLDPTAAKVIIPILLAATGLLLSPAIWSILAGGVFATAGFCVTVWRHSPDFGEHLRLAAGGNFIAAINPLTDAIGAVWASHRGEVLVVTVAVGIAPVVVGLIRPMAATILMTSLLGAVQIMVGTMLMLAAALVTKPTAMAPQRAQLVVAMTAGLMILGIVFQWRREALDDAELAELQLDEEQEAPKEKKGKTQTAKLTEKKKTKKKKAKPTEDAK